MLPSLREPVLEVEVIVAGVRRQMFDRVAKCCPRHGRGTAIEEVSQPLLVSFAGFSDPATYRFLDQVVGIVDQDLSDAEGVIQVAVANEEPGADDRGPPLKPLR
jgi:hypothetical protein